MPPVRRGPSLERLHWLARRFPVVAILGARQVGKTTLAAQYVTEHGGRCTVFDLENPAHLVRLAEPQLALEGLRGLVVIDEVQRVPDLFPLLRVLADRPRAPARFLVLGSAAPALLRQSSESLAGRVAFLELGGFSLDEVAPGSLPRLWLRGGLPRSFLSRSAAESVEWRRSFVRTFLERDLPQLGSGITAPTLYRFWSMLAHWHGQVWNSSEFARSFGVADTTVRRYLDLLTATYMVRQLPPYAVNVGKRLVKAPKVYLRDSGILHALLGLSCQVELEGHPKLGASWEGFALSEVLSRLRARPEECFFWATHGGAELDLLVVRGGRRHGFEFKRTAAPRLTPSMRSALSDLELVGLDLIHAGHETFPLAPRVRAVALERLLEDVTPLR